MKITLWTNNTRTIKKLIFSSVISLARIFTHWSCPVHLPHPGGSHSEECALNKLVLPKSLKMYSQNRWNITILSISFQQRRGLLACKLTKKGETNFPTDKIKKQLFLRNTSKWLLFTQLIKKSWFCYLPYIEFSRLVSTRWWHQSYCVLQ